MFKKDLRNWNLSKRGFQLRPHYNNHALPRVLEEDERAYDPKQDKKTHSPEPVGRIRDQESFRKRIYSSINVQLTIKAPQSDIYYIPNSLAQFQESFQAIIDHEHSRSPAAFTRFAQVAVRQNIKMPAVEWHFDIGDYASSSTRTYNVCDKDLTAFVDLPIDLSIRQKILLRRNEEHSFSYMKEAVKNTLKERSEEDLDVYTFRPFDVVRHGSMVCHRAGPDRSRTLVSVFYSDQTEMLSAYDNSLMAGRIPVLSKPVEGAAKKLKSYYSGLTL